MPPAAEILAVESRFLLVVPAAGIARDMISPLTLCSFVLRR